jgi:hypothetical protein
MIIRVSRLGLTGIAVTFGLYHAALGLASLDQYTSVSGPEIAIGLYLLAMLSSILLYRGIELPLMHAAAAACVAISLPLLVNPALPQVLHHSFATWYVGAEGVLLTVLGVRRQWLAAWIGAIGVCVAMFVGFEDIQFVLFESGLLGGMISLMAAGQAVTWGVERAARQAKLLSDLASAEIASTTATTAMRIERKKRVQEALSSSNGLLEKIVERKGNLNGAERAEMFLAEVELRDEIRGRELVNDKIRVSIRNARKRGVEVVLLDEGGLDGLDQETRKRLLTDVANAIDGIQTGRVTVRTVLGEDWLITVLASDNPNEPPTLWLKLG